MLARLTADGAALRDVAADLAAPVPSCPGWTVRDLLEHTAAVYAHKRTILEQNLDRPPQPWPPDWQFGDVREWFGEQLHGVVEALRTREPSAPVWTWYEPERTVGFWARRMMQETVVHRADGELAAGGPVTPVQDDVAVDGVDELLVRFLAYDVDGYAAAPGRGQRVLVRAGQAAWTVTLASDRASVSPGVVGDVDAAVEGTASELLLALWNRAPYEAVTTSGDAAALAALRAALVATTQ